MKPRLLALCALLLAACGRDATSPPPFPEGSLERGRLFTRWLYDGETGRLWDRFSPETRAIFGSEAGLRSLSAEVRSEAGTERRVVDERVIPWLGSDLYQRVAEFSGSSKPVQVEWMIDSAGTIVDAGVKPKAAESRSRFLDYRTRAALRLPFGGEWFVFWGGRSTLDNYHAAHPDQRFAYDLAVARGGATHSGDPSRNESYYCFNEPVLAPAEGTVAAALDGIADNRPGQTNARQAPGNHVVIDHGGGEFSFLAHLRDGSVAVRAGSTVRAGELVGRCGNSGNSTEPHLHYHLQNNAVFNGGEGLPAQFLDYVANGEAVERGEPVRGQRIRPR